MSWRWLVLTCVHAQATLRARAHEIDELKKQIAHMQMQQQAQSQAQVERLRQPKGKLRRRVRKNKAMLETDDEW